CDTRSWKLPGTSGERPRWETQAATESYEGALPGLIGLTTVGRKRLGSYEPAVVDAADPQGVRSDHPGHGVPGALGVWGGRGVGRAGARRRSGARRHPDLCQQLWGSASEGAARPSESGARGSDAARCVPGDAALGVTLAHAVACDGGPAL